MSQAKQKKRSLAEQASTNKRAKEAEVCSICDKRITDRGDKEAGENAVYCEGKCSSWVHRQYAGLTQPCFKLISESKAPFLCVDCMNTVNNLTAQISKLVGTKPQQVAEASTPTTVANQHMETSDDLPASNKKLSKAQIIPESSTDRKFNVVAFGVPKC